MEATYTLTSDDIYRFQLHFYEVRQRPAYLMFRWGFPALCIAVGLVSFGSRAGTQSRLLLAAFAALGILMLLLAPALWRANLRRHARIQWKAGSRAFAKPVKITITSAGVATQGSQGESRLNWSGVHDLTETGTHVFVWVSESDAVGIPKRAFPHEPGVAARIREFYANATAEPGNS